MILCIAYTACNSRCNLATTRQATNDYRYNY